MKSEDMDYFEELEKLSLRAEESTDMGNARRLVIRHYKDIRFVSDLAKWIVWDGIRWKEDSNGEVERRAKETVKHISDEFNLAIDKELFELKRHAKRSQSHRSINAMISLAKSEPGVSIASDHLDKNQYLLNCLNGTINLKKGYLQPHNRIDLITKLAPVKFDPKATSVRWNRFIDKVTNNSEELKKFLQLSVGYWLSGTTEEEKLFFIFGEGNTGKSTFLESIKATLGDYAATCDFESFIKREGASGVRNDIARLNGKRLVLSIEVEEGKRIAEALVKSLTGGDSITARFLFKEFVEFKPQFKLVMSANHRPNIKHNDTGLWRRILIIPFSNVIPESERDPNLKKRLCNPEKSGSAILAWGVRGFGSWKEEGLETPDIVKNATNDYREDMDPLRDFLAESCITGEDKTAQCKPLYCAYRNWAEENRERYPLSQKRFSGAMVDRGFVKRKNKSSTAWYWIGIELNKTINN